MTVLRWLLRFSLTCATLFGALCQVAALVGRALPYAGELAFVSDRDGNEEIYLIEIGRGVLQNITRSASSDLHPLWSPDGGTLAFTSNRDGNWNIYLMDARSGDVRRLTDNRADYHHATWSPDGRALAFASMAHGTSSPYASHLYISSVDGSNLRDLHDSVGRLMYAPVWSSDGTRILFNLRVASQIARVHMKTDGTDMRVSRDDDPIRWIHDKPFSPPHLEIFTFVNDGYTDICIVDTRIMQRRCPTAQQGRNVEPTWRPL